MFGRFKLLGHLLKTGRLALRLVRDPQVPMAAKPVFGATVLYLGSPIDVVPDWLPIAGQADYLVALLAGLNLFIRACPRWIVQEHEAKLDGKDRGPETAHQRADRAAGDDSSVIEGHYRVVKAEE